MTNKKLLKTLRGETERERVLHRLHCVVLVAGGMTAKQVAGLFGDSPRMIAYWVTRYATAGIEGLGEEKGRGRPSRLDSGQQKSVDEFVRAQRGRGDHVNAATLSAYIKKSFAVDLTERQCWRILKGIV